MLARQLAAANRHVVAIAPQSSPLRRLSGEAGVVGVVTDRSDTAQLEQLLTATDGRSALVVDDAELLVDAPIAAMLESAAKQAPDVGRFVFVAAGRDELMGSFRGLLAAVRRSRSGLLLCPDGALAGEPLGVRVPKSALPSATTPGRGLLVVRGELTCVQVALTHDQFVAAS
jgi:S-DNA-T family DNA segregation ATPase FtsK/SpoIIIE